MRLAAFSASGFLVSALFLGIAVVRERRADVEWWLVVCAGFLLATLLAAFRMVT